jgi:hypothetical protein
MVTVVGAGEEVWREVLVERDLVDAYPKSSQRNAAFQIDRYLDWLGGIPEPPPPPSFLPTTGSCADDNGRPAGDHLVPLYVEHRCRQQRPWMQQRELRRHAQPCTRVALIGLGPPVR